MDDLNALAALYRSGGFAEVIRQGELLRPRYPNAVLLYNMLGDAYRQTSQCDKAERCFEIALGLQPENANAHNGLGILQRQLGKTETSVASFRRALRADPNYVDAYINLGATLFDLRRLDDAVECYKRALSLEPNSVEAHYNMGLALRNLGRTEVSAASFIRTIKLCPDHADAYANLGLAFAELERHGEAVNALKRAIQIRPNNAEAYDILGTLVRRLGQRADAIECHRRAILLKPDFTEAHINLGVALQDEGRLKAAAECYRQAMALNPDHAKAHNNLGTIFQLLGRRTEAIDCYTRALKIDPEFAIARVNRMDQRAHVCDWSFREEDVRSIVLMDTADDAVSPFVMLLHDDNPTRQRIRAERFAKTMFAASAVRVVSPAVRPPKLRIGYFSADFHNHATMFLIARLFEKHDRGRFVLHAYSYGPDKSDAMRQRAATAFDAFHDVRHLDDRAIANLARGEAIDIGVDLKGYTHGSRAGIFSHRPAPVQISFLGFPGTMGAPFIDYLVADETIIPPEERAHYSESILYLPHSYQVNDDTREIAARTPTRAEVGLPERGFVFCCFNNTFKITPREFDIWMRLLTKVDGSVLWLLAANSSAEANLKREASARGVDSRRIAFAQKLPVAEHLARCRLADLFLDTFNCNAHTTASDALWAGLPVLTKPGRAFVARVAASLLETIAVPELIASDEAAYEALALELATNPERLQRIRATLVANRKTSPLFDTTRFTRNIERAYEQAYAQYFAGIPPTDMVITEEPRR